MFNGKVRIRLKRPGVRWLRKCGAAAAVLGAGVVTRGASQPMSGPAKNGEPAWFIYQAPPRPAGAAGPGGPGGGPRPAAPIQACVADGAKLGIAGTDRNELMKRWKEVSSGCLKELELPTVIESTIDRSGTPTCVRSVICMSSNGQGISWDVNPSGLYGGTNNVQRVQWRSNPVNLGYKPTYPYTL